ncbi:MAG: host attachment protein [Pseudomonadota bacterium]
MIWVVTVNAVKCKIYQYQKSPPKLILLNESSHPENRLRKEEFLTSDKPGHYKSSSSNRGAYSPRTDPKEVELDNFAREIAKQLDHGRTDHAYDKLIIIGSPHMNGLLFQHLNKNVKDLVSNEIQKDLQNYTDRELLEFLKTHAQFANTSY